MAGAASDHLAQTQRKHRSQGSVRQLQSNEHGDGHSRHGAKSGSLLAASVGYGRTHEASVGVVGSDQGRVATKALLRGNQGEQDGASRRSQVHTSNSGQDAVSKVNGLRNHLPQVGYEMAVVCHIMCNLDVSRVERWPAV